MTRRKFSKQHSTGENHNVTANEAAASAGLQFRVLTHNIRYATGAPFKGEERWSIRHPLLCSELLFHSNDPATFICLQEVLHSQLWDIMHTFNDNAPGKWAYIGVGRDDGKRAGEYSPIFYRPDVWRLENWGTYWLSPTPRVPSKGWDAASTRIATIGYFEHFQTGKTVCITTTHLDDQGTQSRKCSAELLRDLQLELSMSWASATILAGDFNSPPGDEAYKVLTAPGSILVDVADMVPPQRRHGNELTFTGFSEESSPSRIDFIFAGKEDNIGYETYGVLANRFDDGVFLSDHRACVADFSLPR